MHPTDKHDRDATEYLVIGAGPAGLQMGYHLRQAGHSYRILEAGDGAGTFFEKFPRHRKLISINKVHTGFDDPEINLRWDWNSLLGGDDVPLFKDYSHDYFPDAGLLVDYLRDYARRYELDVRYRTRVAKVERDDLFRVSTEDGRRFAASCLIVASGVRRPYLPPVPGIELTENYADVSVDPADFVGQQVLILGKGNSAFETADNLIATAAVIHVASPTPVQFAWRTHHVGHLRALNNNFLDTYQLKSQNAVLDCKVRRIERRDDGKYVVSVAYTHADEEAENLTYDRVICCTGFRFDDSIFDASCRPELAIKDRFPALTSAWESVNVPGLYFAGTLMQMRDFKKYTSGFIHGFRYNVRSLHRILGTRNHDQPWPSRILDASVDAIAEAIVARVNRTSGLWQQFNMLCDVIAADGQQLRYYEEQPIDWVLDRERGGDREYFMIDLEFGHSQQDPFRVERHPDPHRGAESFFLHPVVRHYRGAELLAEHHVIEDLCADWTKEEMHVVPLRRFVAERLAGRELAVA